MKLTPFILQRCERACMTEMIQAVLSCFLESFSFLGAEEHEEIFSVFRVLDC